MSSDHTKNWPDLAHGLYDRLTGSNAEIAYEFDKMHVQIPSGREPKQSMPNGSWMEQLE